MESTDIHRRTVALIAAYAVALQAMLASFAQASLAAPDVAFASLCSHDASDRPGQPARHGLPCAAICAAMGHSVAGPLPLAIVVAATAPQTIGALNPVDGWVVPRLAIHGPQGARAPPLA